MKERSAFNPFSASSPLKSYGALKKYSDGYEFDGLPYVGKPLPFKEDDAEELRPQLKHNACCAQFDLSDPDDMAQYRAVSQKVCDGRATISFEEKMYDESIKSWRVLIRWMEPYFAPPRCVEDSTKGEKPEIVGKKENIFPETSLDQPKDLFEDKSNGDEEETASETSPESPMGADNTKSRYTSVAQALSFMNSAGSQET